jgi:hypothetical protein
MAITRRSAGIEGEVDHGAIKQRRRERFFVLEAFGSWAERPIVIAVQLCASGAHKLTRFAQVRPLDQEHEGRNDIAMRAHELQRLIFFGVGVEIIYSLEKVAQWLQSQRALERRPSNFLRLAFPPERV